MKYAAIALALLAGVCAAEEEAKPEKLLADLETANKAKDLTSITVLLDPILKVAQTTKDAKIADKLAKELTDSYKLCRGNWGTLRKIIDTIGALRSKSGGKFLKRIAFEEDVEDEDEITLQVQALLAIGMLADKRYLEDIIDMSKTRENKIAEAAYKSLANYGTAKGKVRKAAAEELMKRMEAEYPYDTGQNAGTVGDAAIKRWNELSPSMVKSMQAICHEPTILTVANWREWWKENKKNSKAWKDAKK
jgi:hypothetical protein